MIKRIIKIVVSACIVYGHITTQALPIGLYVKPGGTIYLGEKSPKKDKFAIIINGAWRPDAHHMLELGYVPPLTTIKNENIKNSFVVCHKNIIPLKYFFSIYLQKGASLKSNVGIHAPFAGIGFCYDFTRKLHIDVSWRHYKLFQSLDEDKDSGLRQNGIFVTFGFYIKQGNAADFVS